MDDEYLSQLRSLSVKELRTKCKEFAIDTSGFCEKDDFIKAISLAHEEVEAEEAAEEEEALRQALLMSEESDESLIALPVSELRSRCASRGIKTAGLAEKADLVAALLGTAATSEPTAPPSSEAAASSKSDTKGVEVLTAFAERFWCQAVSADDDATIDHSGGKVLLPHSCLMAIAAVLGGEMPTTLLLRLTYHESVVYVGVQDFIQDSIAVGWLRPKEELPPTGPPTWGPRGALAAVFVPRWVRGSLNCKDGARVQVALVSLPKATGVVLQPQTEGFAKAVTLLGDDPRLVLTPLFNKLPAIAKGDVLNFELLDERHAVEVLAVRGNPHVRCGRPSTFLDVNAALASVSDQASTSQLVPAACTVDADLEVDFAQSSESEGAEERVRKAAEEAEAERKRQAEAAEAEAVEISDPWSATNAGEGHVLGAAEPPSEEAPQLSEREKRLAALAKRGL